MGLVPDTNQGKILFFHIRNTPWSANALAIGTTAAAVTALAAKVAAAQTRLAAANAARQAARSATADLKAAIRDLATAGSDIIKQIRAKAATDGDNVYVLAQIPRPAAPSPIPAPGTPTGFAATLNPDGSLKLRWKCPNPAGSQGTIYQISRRTGAVGPWVTIGGSGTRTFTDATVPAGVASVTYQIVALRSTAAGVAARFTVNFGVGGMAQMTASVVEQGAAPKLAA
jgi:hypothetical protein